MHEEKNTFVEAENVEISSVAGELTPSFERRVPTEREKLAARADATLAKEIMSSLNREEIARELVGMRS